MDQHSVAYVGFDTSKTKHAVAVAEGGREGEVRYLGEIEAAPAAVERLLGKLARQYKSLHVCYEAGPTGYGLYRHVRALGQVCDVIAPSLVPIRPGDRVIDVCGGSGHLTRSLLDVASTAPIQMGRKRGPLRSLSRTSGWVCGRPPRARTPEGAVAAGTDSIIRLRNRAEKWSDRGFWQR